MTENMWSDRSEHEFSPETGYAQAKTALATSLREVSTDEEMCFRVADTDEGRNDATILINKRYAWRGYAGEQRIEDNPNQITLSAQHHGEIIGTATLGIDSPDGLLADVIFKDQIDKFRNNGARVCEITKLAFDPNMQLRLASGALFHIMFIYGHHLHRCTDVFIEINPRHRRYYQTMLGFKTLSDIRINPRVGAPAYLLHLSLAHVLDQVKRFGGTSGHPGTERSLYPYFFSQQEESGIVRRLIST